MKSKADLIAAFLDEMVPTLQSGDNIGDSLNAYLAKRREVAVSEFAEDVKLPVNIIEKQIADTQFYGQADQNEMNKDLNDAVNRSRQGANLITLINGEELIDLLFEQQMGVREKTIVVIDDQLFSEN